MLWRIRVPTSSRNRSGSFAGGAGRRSRRFKALGPRIAGFRGITLYASSADKALQLSHQIARGTRAGDVPPDGPLLLPNMDTIDTTALGNELFGLNHNVFASSRSAISDIGRLLKTGLRPPDMRTPEIRAVAAGGGAWFWKYAF
jgi:esterase/lipase superfamily enzyme